MRYSAIVVIVGSLLALSLVGWLTGEVPHLLGVAALLQFGGLALAAYAAPNRDPEAVQRALQFMAAGGAIVGLTALFIWWSPA